MERLEVVAGKDTLVPFNCTEPASNEVCACEATHRFDKEESQMIRCVHMWSGPDEASYFEEGWIDLELGLRGDLMTGKVGTQSVSFQETASGGAFAWHTAPARQLVITLSGTLEFHMRDGAHFLIRPGDILFAEDTVGSGHSWRLLDEQPWRRVYVVLMARVAVPFKAGAA